MTAELQEDIRMQFKLALRTRVVELNIVKRRLKKPKLDEKDISDISRLLRCKPEVILIPNNGEKNDC